MSARTSGQLVAIFRARLLSGLLWKVLSAIAMQGSVLLSTLIVARILDLRSFGVFALLVTTVMMLAGVAQAGIGLTATKFVGEFLNGDARQVCRVLRMCRIVIGFMGIASALMLMVLSPLIAAQMLGEAQLAVYIRWVSMAVAFQTVVTYQNSALEGFGAFRQISRAGAAAGIIHLLCTSMGAWFWGLDGAIAGFIVASGSRLGIFSLVLRSVCRDHAIPSPVTLRRADWAMLLAFAVPAGLASLITLPCMWLVTTMVARLPDGLALAGLFAVAHQIRLTVLQLPTMLNAVSFSVLSRLKGQGLHADLPGVFWANMAFSAALCVIVVLPLSWLAEPLLRLYGPQFAAGKVLLVILLLSIVPEMLTLAAYQLVQSSGRMWRSLLLIIGPRDLLYLGMAAAWMPSQGIAGAALAYLVAHSVGLISTVLVGRGAWSARPAIGARHG